jgi:hypothetical protein
MMAMLVGLNVVAWLGWIDALLHSYQVVCDLASRKLQFFLHPRKPAAYTLTLDRVTAVEIVTVKRIKGDGNSMRAVSDDEIVRRGIAAIACYSLVVEQDDGRKIHILESTDRPLVEEIQAMLLEAVTTEEMPKTHMAIS